MRKRLPGKWASILLALALVGIAVGCTIQNPPVPPAVYWSRTGEYSTTDRDLTLVLLSYSFLRQGGQWYSTLFYAVLTPQELSGWQVSPGPVAVNDERGPLGTGRGIPIESVGGVTLGALVLSPFGYDADALKIAITTMEAKNPTTGEVQELKGDWHLVPLRTPPGTPPPPTVLFESKGPTMLGGSLWPKKAVGTSGARGELTHQGTTLRYILHGDYRGGPPSQPGQPLQPWQWWVIGQQFWVSDPEPQDIFVLVTSEGEVRRVSADEYLQRGFRILEM